MLIRRAACRKVIRLTEESFKGFDRCPRFARDFAVPCQTQPRTRWIVVLHQIDVGAQFANRSKALVATYSYLVPDWTSLITRIT